MYECNWIKLLKVPNLSVNFHFTLFCVDKVHVLGQPSCQSGTNPPIIILLCESSEASIYIYKFFVRQLKDLKYNYETFTFHEMLKVE